MRKIIIIVLSVLLLLTSCGLKEEAVFDTVTIASWNVANLFDGKDDGNEYSEYQTQNGWTDSQYKVRLKKIETVLGYENLKDAKIIVLNEVENENVVQDILSLSSVQKRGFCYYALCGEEDGAINTAVISSLPITVANVHAITGQRPVLEVNVNTIQGDITVLAIHGKSNLGDAETDISQRIATGQVIEKLVQFVKAERPLCTIVLAGDFNEEVSDSHIIVNQKSWDNFWDKTNGLNASGSYLYQDTWEKFDNVLVLKNCPWQLEAGNVVFYGILQNANQEIDAWKRYLLSGVSDHLPVWIKIKR